MFHEVPSVLRTLIVFPMLGSRTQVSLDANGLDRAGLTALLGIFG